MCCVNALRTDESESFVNHTVVVTFVSYLESSFCFTILSCFSKPLIGVKIDH